MVVDRNISYIFVFVFGYAVNFSRYFIGFGNKGKGVNKAVKLPFEKPRFPVTLMAGFIAFSVNKKWRKFIMSR